MSSLWFKETQSCLSQKYRRVHLLLTFREGHDFIMYVSSYSSLLHLLVAGRDAAVADVVLDGVVEKHGILGNHADMSSQGYLLHLRRDDKDVVITGPECACNHTQLHTVMLKRLELVLILLLVISRET